MDLAAAGKHGVGFFLGGGGIIGSNVSEVLVAAPDMQLLILAARHFLSFLPVSPAGAFPPQNYFPYLVQRHRGNISIFRIYQKIFPGPLRRGPPGGLRAQLLLRGGGGEGHPHPESERKRHHCCRRKKYFFSKKNPTTVDGIGRIQRAFFVVKVEVKNCRSKDKHPDVTTGDIVFRFETFKQQVGKNGQVFFWFF